MDNKHRKVLLIEDDPDAVYILRGILSAYKSHSFDVDCADSLQAGLECLARGSIDVVLLDLGLPDSQGLDTFVRVHDQAPEVPIIVLTGLDDETLAIKAVQQGAEDYLPKQQVESNLLVRSICYAIERHQIMAKWERQLRELLGSETRFRNMIEKNADGIIIVDRNGIVRFVNPGAEALLGHKAEELLGELFGFPVVGETMELDIVHRGRESGVAEMRVVETTWEGETAYLASLRDITERKRMLEELKQTQQQQLQLKDQFLSNVSHELRSPLTIIHQLVTILLDGLSGELNPEQHEHLEITLKNVNQLRTMIKDLLEVTRAETGKLTVEPQYTSVAEVIAETVSTIKSGAAAKDIGLSAEVASDLPHVYADPERVRQILINLIDNGVKFTPEKGTITVRAQVFNEEPGFLCTTVADTGCGISPEEKKKIFDYLYQVENTVEVSRKGLGLGLYICKELVSRHGGRIWVESQPGQGSTFFFTLPIFSLTSLLAPILTTKNLQRGSLMLITVDVFPAEKRSLTKTDERALRESTNVLRHCILPGLDVLLPRVGGTKWGEIFFIVACADGNGTGVLLSRIQEQLECCEELQDGGLTSEASFTIVNIPPMDHDKPLEQLVKEIASSIEDLVKATLYKRREFYERKENSPSG